MSKINYDTTNGYIPKSLAIYSKQPKTITVPYVDKDGEILFGANLITVKPAYAVDNENENRKKSAYEWAESYDWVTKIKSLPDIEYRLNEPMSGVRICDLERRDEGGRAYKVITPDGYYFDLREDVLLDTIYECGVARGGILLGEFIWAIAGSQMKLIRVGSKLHERLIQTGEIRKITKKLGPKDWVVGDVYVGKNNEPKMFMGFIDTVEFWEHWNSKVGEYKIFKNAALWYNFSRYAREEIKNDPVKDMYDDIKKGTPPAVYLEKPANLVTKLTHHDIPNTFFKDIQTAGLKAFKLYYEDNKKDHWSRGYWNLKHCLMRETGQPMPDLPDFVKDYVKKTFKLDLDQIKAGTKK